MAIVLSNFDESRKLTAKRKIIDEIENILSEGKSMAQATQIVLGKDFVVEIESHFKPAEIPFSKHSTTVTAKA